MEAQAIEPAIDTVFADAVSESYERYLVPLIFEPYAADLAARVARRHPAAVLEIAAGTGVLTRQLARMLPAQTTIIATDLNQPMLDRAIGAGTARPVTWRQADAMDLPFPDDSFDVVACQFGVMFFSNKVQAFSEVRRVLRPGGQFLFSVWNRIEKNEFADAITSAMASFFPEDPPRFLRRIVHGYFDLSVITRDLEAAGFSRPPASITISARSHAASPNIPALAYCQGTPLRNEIKERDAAHLKEAVDCAARAVACKFGWGAVDAEIQAHVITVDR